MTEGIIEGVVINLNGFGATVRLVDGALAGAPASDVETHRAIYARSLERGQRLNFERRSTGRRAWVQLAPQIVDEALEDAIADYQRGAERHFLQKKPSRRTAHRPA